MSKTIRYGIFGNASVEVDDDGFIEIPVIIQESGLFGGSAPPELRIHAVAAYGDDEFNRQYTALLNRRTDLPFYLGKAKIKITDHGTIVRDADVSSPLPDKP